MPNNQRDIFSLAEGRMHSALEAYYIWKWLNQSINTNHPEGEAYVKRNLEVINTYKYFFHQIMVSTYKSFVADLAIFFDAEKYEESFSIGKLLQHLKADDEGMDDKKLKKDIDAVKREHKKAISLVLEMRNADVAHQELDARSRHVLYEEIEGLFSGVQDILNLITQRHARSTTLWDHIEKEVAHHMEWVFENLERGENARLEEIEEKYRNT